MASAAAETGLPRPSARFLFTLTIFTGSFLLFLVQPMIARMALPKLGGAPAVWNSAMLVYQALLLAGYAYAHWLGRWPGRVQAAVHIAAFAVAAVMLPIGLGSAVPPANANPVTWVPWLLLASIGPLFLVVSAQAPLMQRWFTLAGGGDPYPLYAASNLGSFGGLIAYPLVVEPLMPVAHQSLAWSAGYATLALLVAGCTVLLPRGRGGTAAIKPSTPAPGWRQMAKWVLISAIPSGLMLSTTLHLTTDIVAMPLLWVVPLGLYLLSFSVAFSENRATAAFITRIAPLLLLIAACGVFVDVTILPLVFALAAVASLFAISVALHSRLFDERPEPSHLTLFYLAMSVGGVMGGLFCALFAPQVFDWTYEHPILMLAAALLLAPEPVFEAAGRFWSESPHAARVTRFGLVLLLLISLVGQGAWGLPESRYMAGAATIVLLLVGVFSIGNRWLYAAALGGAMLSIGGWTKMGYSLAEGKMTRSYFGVYSIRDSRSARLLVHGTTIHGIQNRGSAERERSPISYYAPPSGVGAALSAAPQLFGPAARIGIVGLGSGTLSCYARSGQQWTFYEIDPVMVEIARDPRRFTFLSRCLPDAKVDIGDARLVLAGKPANSADILVVDAFSSDAVPMHLLTREAFATYRSHLAPNGLLMVHISNRYLDLRPVVAAAANEGWTARIRTYVPDRQGYRQNHSGSIWVALSPEAGIIAALAAADPLIPWEPLSARPGFAPWTDGFASILPIIKWSKDKK